MYSFSSFSRSVFSSVRFFPRFFSPAASFSTAPSSHLNCYLWGSFGDSGAFRNSEKEQLRPLRFDSPDSSGVEQFSFASHHYAFLTQSGAVYTFGNGKYLELGHGEKAIEHESKPRRVEHLPKIKQIALGKYHSVALAEDGSVYTWGWGGSFFGAGALGHGDKSSHGRPKLVESLKGEKIISISAGHNHTMCVSDKGELFAFGKGEFGVLGTGGNGDEVSPVRLEAFNDKKVKSVVSEALCNAAILNDGTVWTWGKNSNGELGLGHGLLDQFTIENVPVQVVFDSSLSEASDEEREKSTVNVVSLDAGNKHMVACNDEGRLYYWGGKIHFSPSLITGDNGVFLKQKIVSAAAGNGFTAAVDQYGQLFAFGRGKAGCLGHGGKGDVRSPMRVDGFGPQSSDEAKAKNPFGRVVQVFAGNNLIAALTEGGQSAQH